MEMVICPKCKSAIKGDLQVCSECHEEIDTSGIERFEPIVAAAPIPPAGASPMFICGWIVIAAGILYTVIALNLPTTAPYSSVLNSGLLADQRNHVSLAETILLCGVLLIGFGKKNP